jgi:hypothetical protein
MSLRVRHLAGAVAQARVKLLVRYSYELTCGLTLDSAKRRVQWDHSPPTVAMESEPIERRLGRTDFLRKYSNKRSGIFQ